MRVSYNSNKQGSDVEELYSLKNWQKNIPSFLSMHVFSPCLRCLSKALHCVPRILKVLGKSNGLCKTMYKEKESIVPILH